MMKTVRLARNRLFRAKRVSNDVYQRKPNHACCDIQWKPYVDTEREREREKEKKASCWAIRLIARESNNSLRYRKICEEARERWR